jgi:hypothetical protein
MRRLARVRRDVASPDMGVTTVKAGHLARLYASVVSGNDGLCVVMFCCHRGGSGVASKLNNVGRCTRALPAPVIFRGLGKYPFSTAR